MIHATFSDFRRRLAHYMDLAEQDRDIVFVTRQGAEPAILIAQSEYESMRETLYLLSNPINAERLNRSIAAADAGDGMEVEWDQEAGTYKPV